MAIKKSDRALVFDGTDDYASTGSARFPFPLAAHSLSAWVNLDDPSGKRTVFTLHMDLERGTELFFDPA